MESARGSRCTSAEDSAIVKEWIAVSKNPIVSTEQTSSDFFASIANIYNEKFKPGNRDAQTVEYVNAPCKSIQKEFMLFSGCNARARRSKPTAVSPD